MSDISNNDIGIVITALDASATIRHAVETAKEVGKVVVVDRGSRDDTVAVAQKAGAEVVTPLHMGVLSLQDARQAAMNELDTMWVLFVGQDEWVSGDLGDYLKNWIKKAGDNAALFIPRRTYIMQKLIHGLYPDYQLRLVRREQVTLSGDTIMAEGSKIKVPARRRELSLIRITPQVPDAICEHFDASNMQNITVFQILYQPVKSFCKLYFGQGFWKYGMVGYIQSIREVQLTYDSLIGRYEQLETAKLERLIELRKQLRDERREREAARNNS